ncbi:MAG: ROK family protein [Planctomycetes bacterium]|nr:ROK family protein [Planctomycetota bacterium]
MRPESPLETLSIDIGGSHLKAACLDAEGRATSARVKIDTPNPAKPDAVLAGLDELRRTVGGNPTRCSVGFPGVIREGVVQTAVNLDPQWRGFDLAQALHQRWSLPVRVANDADMQGAAVVSGKGVELVITLGTGIGSALFVDGRIVPNLELGHAPFRKGETFEEQLGKAARKEVGNLRWNQRLEAAILHWRTVFNFDRLYLGGGMAKNIEFKLPLDVAVVDNEAGVLGGIKLWEEGAKLARATAE